MREVHLSEIKMPAEIGAVTGATLNGHKKNLLLTFYVGVEDFRLITKAGNPRTFRGLTCAIQLLHKPGIGKAVLDMEKYYVSDPDLTSARQTEGAIPFRASTQKRMLILILN